MHLSKVFLSTMAGLALVAVEQPAFYAQSESSNREANAAQAAMPLIPLSNQKYALCAGAVTFNFDGITYARCRLKDGNSLAEKHPYQGGDADTVNRIGNAPGNGSFMVSTYSPPSTAEYALYSCPSQGAYAQCNGGLCFTNTTGKNFPGLGRLSNNEIICSCPIKIAKDYHVTGPAQCPSSRSKYDSICGQGSEKNVSADGVSLFIGAGGPPAITVAMNDYYDKVFKTTSNHKVCERP
jgi:hypothetical protein